MLELDRCNCLVSKIDDCLAIAVTIIIISIIYSSLITSIINGITISESIFAIIVVDDAFFLTRTALAIVNNVCSIKLAKFSLSTVISKSTSAQRVFC
jgi:hypothetical protein